MNGLISAPDVYCLARCGWFIIRVVVFCPGSLAVVVVLVVVSNVVWNMSKCRLMTDTKLGDIYFGHVSVKQVD